ncbi:MAG: Ger(x)C family spore germination protein [Syntrophomonadaceae bacterium]|nr:Ger(x)C family spore germination protein [Syntrophomonadaceae bacterium]
MKKHCLIMAMLLLAVTAAGCGTTEINKSSIPLGFGADFKNNQVIFTTQLAIPTSPEKNGGGGPQFIAQSATGATVAEAARRISLTSSQYPLWSHSSLMLWGEGLAQSDLSQFMDFVSRNRFVRKNIQVVVTHKASVEEIFNTKPIATPYTATAITDLLQTQETQLGIYTPITLIQVIERFAEPGIEPVIPIITVKKAAQGNQLLLEHMAVFRDRRMVGILTEKESRGYRFLSPRMIEGGLFTVPFPGQPDKKVTLEMSRSQAKIKPLIQGQNIVIRIEISAEGNFYEQNSSGDLFTLTTFKKLEKLADQEITSEINAAISKAQSLNSDIFGWGKLIRQTDPELWKQIGPEWPQRFTDVQPEITVKYQLRRSYLRDKSFVFRE